MIIERGFNQGDVSVADEVCAAKLIEHEYLAPTDLPGPDILRTQIRQARAEVTNFHLTIGDMVVDGDKIGRGAYVQEPIRVRVKLSL